MSADPFPVDIAAYVNAARADEALFRRARDLMPPMGHLWDRGDVPKKAVSGSDCGSCALSLWAELHGRFDIPDSSFYARDRGTLLGAWYGVLLKVAFQERHPDQYVVTLEWPTTYQGVPGHVDVAFLRGPKESIACDYIVEFKTTAAFKTPEPHLDKKNGESDRHYCVQAAGYALGLGAPVFSIARICGGGDLVQSDYDTESWRESVDLEYARLRTAERDEPPPADPSRSYLCQSCLYGACPKNVNENRGTSATGVLAALQASLALAP